jgi:hypothetical protein
MCFHCFQKEGRLCTEELVVIGNRISSTTYNADNEATNQTYSGGNQNTLPGGSSVKYDAWGRLVYRWVKDHTRFQ